MSEVVMTGNKYTPVEVARAARRLDLALAGMHLDVARSMEMTPAEVLAMAHLGVDDELSPGELTRRLRLRSGATTALVDRLVAHGYVVREPHPTDRRKLVVRLTAHGRKATMHELGPMIATSIRLVGSLPEADRETVGRFMDELAGVVAGRRPAGTAAKQDPPGGRSGDGQRRARAAA